MNAAAARIARRLALGGVAFLAAVVTMRASSDPYVQHRETTLGYHGPSEDMTGLTEFRLGWFGPSDADDPATGDLWWAANLAINDANASSPDGAALSPVADRPSPRLPFRLVPRWSVDPWGTGVSQLTRMVFDEQPLALLGSIDSATTHLAEQVVAKSNLPLVSPIATDPSVTLAGVPWMFSCAPSDDAIAEALVGDILASLAPRDATANESRPTALVLLATTDHESRMTKRAVLRACSRKNYLPEFQFECAAGSTEIAGQIAATAEARPGAVLIIARTDDAARLTKAVRAALGPVAIFGGPSMSRRGFLEQAGPAAESVRFPLLFSPRAGDASATDFIGRFTRARQHAPDYTAALTYDATRLLLAAIRQAGPNRTRIRDALIELSPWAGVAGTIDFDGTGQNRRASLPIGTIHDGAIVPVASLSPSP